MATTNQPTVSVIIPCFNAEGTLERTLESVLNQSFCDIEVVCVDDGSSDATPNLLEKWSAKDQRLQVVCQVNSGVASARNAGIAAARGRFIAFLDSDDLFDRHHLREALRHFSGFTSLGVHYCPATFIDLQGNPTGQSRPHLGPLTPADLLSSNPTTTCSTLVVRREVFRDVGNFRPDMRRNEDQEWLFRVSLSGWVIAGRPQAMVSYRTNPHGLASDLEGMRRGFETMLGAARALTPELVRRNENAARARMYLYLARRAVRLKLPSSVVRKYAMCAVRAYPALILSEPRSSIATLAAAIAPRAVEAVLSRGVRA